MPFFNDDPVLKLDMRQTFHNWFIFCSINHRNKNLLTMNMKRTFGAILTVLGIVGLLYAAFSIIQHTGQVTSISVVAIIALLFFFSGISLVRTTKDEV
jgi:uncharacterized membrane protein